MTTKLDTERHHEVWTQTVHLHCLLQKVAIWFKKMAIVGTIIHFVYYLFTWLLTLQAINRACETHKDMLRNIIIFVVPRSVDHIYT